MRKSHASQYANFGWLLVCVIYFPVMFSLFILSMYAVIGVVFLFIIKLALALMEENNKK